MLRRFAAALLFAAALAGATTEHHHALEAEDSPSSPASRSVVSSHDGRSAASHVHAILRIVDNDPCWACHWSRHAAITGSSVAVGALRADRALPQLPSRAAVCVARFTRSSRAPPALL
jgi:hypothetical protein